MTERTFKGFARLIGTVPNTLSPFAKDEIELYELDPPLCGFRVVAASKTLWAVRIQIPPEPPEDPISTAFYGVTGGEALQIVSEQKLPGSTDGRSPQRALAEAGYVLW
jgi:hypothetical protein